MSTENQTSLTFHQRVSHGWFVVFAGAFGGASLWGWGVGLSLAWLPLSISLSIGGILAEGLWRLLVKRETVAYGAAPRRSGWFLFSSLWIFCGTGLQIAASAVGCRWFPDAFADPRPDFLTPFVFWSLFVLVMYRIQASREKTKLSGVD